MDLSRLRAESVRLKRECEILKKAMAYFARDIVRGSSEAVIKSLI